MSWAKTLTARRCAFGPESENAKEPPLGGAGRRPTTEGLWSAATQGPEIVQLHGERRGKHCRGPHTGDTATPWETPWKVESVVEAQNPGTLQNHRKRRGKWKPV